MKKVAENRRLAMESIARDVAAIFAAEGYEAKVETMFGVEVVVRDRDYRTGYRVGPMEADLEPEQARAHVEYALRVGLQRNPHRGPSRPYIQKREHGTSARLAACMRSGMTEEQAIDALFKENHELMLAHMRRAELMPVPSIVLSETDAVRAAVAAERRRCLDIVTNVEPGDAAEMRQRISDQIRG